MAKPLRPAMDSLVSMAMLLLPSLQMVTPPPPEVVTYSTSHMKVHHRFIEARQTGAQRRPNRSVICVAADRTDAALD